MSDQCIPVQYISELLYHSYSYVSYAEATNWQYILCLPPHPLSIVQLLELLKSFCAVDAWWCNFLFLWYLSLRASLLCWSPRCWCHSASCEECGEGPRALIPNCRGGVWTPFARHNEAPLAHWSHLTAASGGVRLWCRCNSTKVNWFPMKPQWAWCPCW